MKKHLFNSLPRLGILLLFVFLGMQIQAQTQQKISGIVKDMSGEPLIGVNVIEKGTTNGSITDAYGKYSIALQGKKAVLSFSYIGYLTQDVPVTNQKEINVTLKEDAEELEEVVVIGYGTAKKRDLTGAISTVKTEKMEAESPRSIQDLLRSSAAGLNIGVSTDAAGTANLQVRGKNTLTAGSSPLLVLDGSIYMGALSDINPNDIQSVDVLKDASSVAVYGAKASNGVVAITTKKGKTGKPVVSFNANVGFAQPYKIPAALDGPGFLQFRQDYEEGKLTPEEMAKTPGKFMDPRLLGNIGVDPLAWYNYGRKDPVTVLPSQNELMTTWLGGRLNLKTIEIENYLGGIETNWDDIVFQTALQQDYTASVSNRTDNFSYYWSLGYADREGIRTDDRYKNFRTRLNLESKVTSFLTIGMNTQFSTEDKGAQAADVGQRTNNSPYTTNEIDNLDSPYRMYPSGDNNTKNPFFDNLYRDKREITHALNAKIYAIVKLPFGIEYEMDFTPRYKWYEFMKHESSEHPEWNGKGGYAERRNNKEYNWNIDNIIRWKYKLNNTHNFEVTLLANAEKGQTWDTSIGAQNFSPSDVLGYHNMGSATVLNMLKDGKNEDTYQTGDALMARIYYSFKDKYMLTASVRRDGFSAFGSMNPRATFPAVALGWVFTSEKFMEKTADWLNYGKLRFSWGQNGNRDIGRYEALAWLNSSLHPYIDKNGNVYLTSQVYVNHMGNTNLKWERTASYNIGMDFSLFGDKLRGSVETYMAETNDLLVNRALPIITGFADVKANLGKLANRGFEMSLNADLIEMKNFSWATSGTFSLNRREIKSLYGDMVDIKDENGNVIGQKEADDYENKRFIGRDPDQIWDYVGDGVWQLGEEKEAAKYGNKPGDFKYVDQNGDGLLNNEDRVFQKYNTPRFNVSWRNEFTFYKDFVFSFMMYSHLGKYGTFNPASNDISLADRHSALDLPRWTATNPTNEYGRLGSKNLGNHYVNKSFVRMENITLSYNVPQNLLKKISVQNMRFSLSVRNAFVLSKYTFRDPEEDPTKGDQWVPRSFNIGVNFTL